MHVPHEDVKGGKHKALVLDFFTMNIRLHYILL